MLEKAVFDKFPSRFDERPHGLDILYVGPFPTHHVGGSVTVGEYVLNGLSALGHRVRALAPITPAGIVGFRLNCPRVEVVGFRVPYFAEARAAIRNKHREATEVGRLLSDLIPRLRPEILLAGHEAVAQLITNHNSRRSFASVLIAHGGDTFDILERGERGSAALLRRLTSFDLVISVSEHKAQRLRQFGLRNVRAIPNPLDLRSFRPARKNSQLKRELGIADNAVVVLHASRMVPVKRPFDLIEAASEALKKDPRLFFVMVGKGSSRPALKDACRKAGIMTSFRFVGWIDHCDVPRYMNLADLVVVLSESEGQPMVCLEAQACARVVLASDIAGCREIIEDGKTGVLFRKGDISDLAAAMLSIARDSARRAKIGRNARIAVRSHEADRIVAEYSAAIAATLERRRGDSERTPSVS